MSSRTPKNVRTSKKDEIKYSISYEPRAQDVLSSLHRRFVEKESKIKSGLLFEKLAIAYLGFMSVVLIQSMKSAEQENIIQIVAGIAAGLAGIFGGLNAYLLKRSVIEKVLHGGRPTSETLDKAGLSVAGSFLNDWYRLESSVMEHAEKHGYPTINLRDALTELESKQILSHEDVGRAIVLARLRNRLAYGPDTPTVRELIEGKDSVSHLESRLTESHS